MKFYIGSDNNSGVRYHDKISFIEEILNMIDRCDKNGGTEFSITVDSDTNCFYSNLETSRSIPSIDKITTNIGSVCCSVQCEKYSTCLKAYGTGPSESFYTMASGNSTNDGSLNNIKYTCGPESNYKMYVDINKYDKNI